MDMESSCITSGNIVASSLSMAAPTVTPAHTLPLQVDHASADLLSCG